MKTNTKILPHTTDTLSTPPAGDGIEPTTEPARGKGGRGGWGIFLEPSPIPLFRVHTVLEPQQDDYQVAPARSALRLRLRAPLPYAPTPLQGCVVRLSGTARETRPRTTSTPNLPPASLRSSFNLFNEATRERFSPHARRAWAATAGTSAGDDRILHACRHHRAQPPLTASSPPRRGAQATTFTLTTSRQ